MSLQITGKYLNYNHNFEVRYGSVSNVVLIQRNFWSTIIRISQKQKTMYQRQSTVDVQKVPGGRNQVEHK